MSSKDRDMTDDHSDGSSVIRHEEQLAVGTAWREDEHLRARKHVETRSVEEDATRGVEHAEVERMTIAEDAGDSGEIETLPDGSISIPLFEERLVVTKQQVVRERVIIRKRTEVEHHRVQADLRAEHVDLEATRLDGDR